jgi:hypothetical protein
MVHDYCNRKNNLVPQVKEELFNLTEMSLKQGNFEFNDNSSNYRPRRVGLNICSFLEKKKIPR